MILRDEDIKFECPYPYGKDYQGGQHCAMTYAGVKGTHIPTGTEAYSEIARSQHKNRQIVKEMLEYALTFF